MFLCDYFGSVNTMNDYEQGLEPVDTEVNIQGEDWGLVHHTLLANCYDTILDKKVQLVRVEGSQFYFLKQNLCLLGVLQAQGKLFLQQGTSVYDVTSA